jgi:SPX domain protein involved in polyphosphate accumulation
MLQKIKITQKHLPLLIYNNGKNRNRSNEVIQDTYSKRNDTKGLA